MASDSGTVRKQTDSRMESRDEVRHRPSDESFLEGKKHVDDAGQKLEIGIWEETARKRRNARIHGP
jgi:hypothetical protein